MKTSDHLNTSDSNDSVSLGGHTKHFLLLVTLEFKGLSLLLRRLTFQDRSLPLSLLDQYRRLPPYLVTWSVLPEILNDVRTTSRKPDTFMNNISLCTPPLPSLHRTSLLPGITVRDNWRVPTGSSDLQVTKFNSLFFPAEDRFRNKRDLYPGTRNLGVPTKTHDRNGVRKIIATPLCVYTTKEPSRDRHMCVSRLLCPPTNLL